MSTKAEKEFKEILERVLKMRSYVKAAKGMSPSAKAVNALTAISAVSHGPHRQPTVEDLVTILGHIECAMEFLRNQYDLDRDMVLKAKVSSLKKSFPSLRKVAVK